VGHDGVVPPLVYRPTMVRVLSVVSWLLLAVLCGSMVASDAGETLRWLPLLALLAALVYALFWRPAVEVDDEAVSLRNLVHDVRVPWARLEAVDTRYSLTLHTGERRFAAWAAPAPGRSLALRQSRWDAAALAALGSDLDYGLRSSSAPNTDSGGAALMVRSRWEHALTQPGVAGHDSAPPVRVTIAAVPAALLAVTTVASVAVITLT
jgi:hypothetical protein